MKDEAFDPASPGDRAKLFACIQKVYPELNEGILESALNAATVSDVNEGRLHWALKIARIAAESHRSAGGHVHERVKDASPAKT